MAVLKSGEAIAIAASITAQPLERHLRHHLSSRGITDSRIIIGAYNQLHQACQQPSVFFGELPGTIILLWRAEDMFPEQLDDLNSLRTGLAEFAKNIRVLREHFFGTLIVSLPPFPAPPFSFLAAQREVPSTWYAQVIQEWWDLLDEIDNLKFFDLPNLMSEIGYSSTFDARTWYLYRQPWRDSFWRRLALEFSRLITAETVAQKKCLVLDADNTLWGGIIGEDGLAGIFLGEDFPGNAYRDFQRVVLRLRERGILLAIASKNNENDFFSMLDTHDAMILKREDFSVFEINWGSKVDSLLRIAAQLNIGVDALVFVDDNPKEIAEVNERLPAVSCLLVPDEITELPALLLDTALFDQPAVTSEDLKRTEMLKAESGRTASRAALSEEEFKRGLGLAITVFQARPQHFARITQLINKTNQFNLTTIRRSAAEVATLSALSDHALLGMSMRDKYGDYGLVGVAILKKNKATCLIDSFLVSCRALGRDAEISFMAELAIFAESWGCGRMEGLFIPTPKKWTRR